MKSLLGVPSATLLALLLTHSAVAAAAEHAPSVVRTVQVAQATFHLEFHPQDADTARQVAGALRRAVPAAERWGLFEVPVWITIHPTHEAFEAATGRRGYAWLRAWSRRTTVDVQSPHTWSHGPPSDEVMAQFLTHELTHCLTYQLSGGPADWATHGIPRWFLEGMASTTAGEEEDAVPAATYDRSALQAGDPLRAPRALLRTRPELVYATAHRAFVFLLDRFGEDRVRLLLFTMREGAGFADAFRRALGISVEEFESEFDRVAGTSAG